MPRGQTLASTLSLLKAEIGYSLAAGVATADDQALYRLIDNEQKRLAADFDWPFLKNKPTVNVAARTANLPTTIVFERPVKVLRKFNNFWLPIEHGIGEDEYNILDSDRGLTQDPIQRWQLQSDGTTFEVWPVPVTQQTVKFEGQRPVTSLLTAGAYDPAKTLDLDDLLVVLFVAANRLGRVKAEDAALMLQKAQDRLTMLRAALPEERQGTTILGGDSGEAAVRRTVGMTVIAAS